MKKLLFLLCFYYVFPVQAKLFQNSYVGFEIPESWECRAFGTDWVCLKKNKTRNVQGLITVTAKISGPNDTLNQYSEFLKHPKTWFNSKKTKIISEKLDEPRSVFINKFPWVNGIHKNSEIKSYISRYVVTVCCENTSSKLGILVVLSAHENHYTKFSADFLKSVNSLRVMDIEKAIAKVRASQAANSNSPGAMAYIDSLLDESQLGANAGDDTGLFGLPKAMAQGLLILLALILAFVIYKLMRRKKSKKSRKVKYKK